MDVVEDGIGSLLHQQGKTLVTEKKYSLPFARRKSVWDLEYPEIYRNKIVDIPNFNLGDIPVDTSKSMWVQRAATTEYRMFDDGTYGGLMMMPYLGASSQIPIFPTLGFALEKDSMASPRQKGGTAGVGTCTR